MMKASSISICGCTNRAADIVKPLSAAERRGLLFATVAFVILVVTLLVRPTGIFKGASS